MSGFYSLRELAETVAQVGRKEFNLPVTIQRMENPRIEPDRHLLEQIYEKLPNDFNFKPTITLEEAVYNMFVMLMKPDIKKRIEQKKHLIIPRTWWSGANKQVERIEMMDDITIYDKK
jgi:hypothetical protein